tara:strand:- start:8856 stop:9266 length:411 start_codon:yes stop_codon:yes gene_type:complete
MARLVPKIYPVDVDENTPIGVSFPLTVGTQRQNFITTKQVHDNLRNLLLTMKGERPMQPTFGSDLYNLIFEPLQEEQLQEAATIAINDAVATWMPAVQIMGVAVSTNIDSQTVTVSVRYAVEGWEANDVLNLTVRV